MEWENSTQSSLNSFPGVRRERRTAESAPSVPIPLLRLRTCHSPAGAIRNRSSTHRLNAGLRPLRRRTQNATVAFYN